MNSTHPIYPYPNERDMSKVTTQPSAAAMSAADKIVGPFVHETGSSTHSGEARAKEVQRVAALIDQEFAGLVAAARMAFEDLEKYEYVDLPDGYAVMKTVKSLRRTLAHAAPREAS